MHPKNEKKLKALEKSLEEGVITREEFDAQKKELADHGGSEEIPSEKQAAPESPEAPKKGSEKILLWSIFALVAVVAAFIVVFLFFKNVAVERPQTIEDLHALNLQGKLDPEEGYVYNQFSFVELDGLWYTLIQNPTGTEQYSIPLHYGPRELEGIQAAGRLDDPLFNEEIEYFITFDPEGENLQYVALAVSEFDQNIIKVLGKLPVAACSENKTLPCQTRPIMMCDNTDRPVVYFKQKSPAQVIYDSNCIVVQGNGTDLVRATDRLLYGFYGIMQPANS